MIIYNITFHLENEVHDKALLYLKNDFISKAVGCGFMLEPRLAYIHRQHEETGSSYSLQFNAKNIETLNLWNSTTGKTLFDEINSLFGNKVIGFSTILEEIELG